MKKVEKGRFSLRDAILFVVATAFGLGEWLVRQNYMAHGGQIPERLPTGWFDGIIFGSILATSWAYAVVIISLLSTRRSWGRVFSQPGVVACFTAVVVSLSMLLNDLVAVPFAYRDYKIQQCLDVFRFYCVSNLLPQVLAPAVAGSWMLLLVGRRWKFNKNAINLIGMFVGIYWLVTAPVMRWFAMTE